MGQQQQMCRKATLSLINCSLSTFILYFTEVKRVACTQFNKAPICICNKCSSVSTSIFFFKNITHEFILRGETLHITSGIKIPKSL